jgi:hypothetical protein
VPLTVQHRSSTVQFAGDSSKKKEKKRKKEEALAGMARSKDPRSGGGVPSLNESVCLPAEHPASPEYLNRD